MLIFLHEKGICPFWLGILKLIIGLFLTYRFYFYFFILEQLHLWNTFDYVCKKLDCTLAMNYYIVSPPVGAICGSWPELCTWWCRGGCCELVDDDLVFSEPSNWRNTWEGSSKLKAKNWNLIPNRLLVFVTLWSHFAMHII